MSFWGEDTVVVAVAVAINVADNQNVINMENGKRTDFLVVYFVCIKSTYIILYNREGRRSTVRLYS